MEIENVHGFYTEAHLSKCIEIPIYIVTEELNKFVKFKGLLRKDADSTPFYVDGYIIIDETRVTQTGEDEYEDSLTKAKCSKYCSRPELENNSYIVSMPFLIEESYINYSEFKEALNKFGIPLIEKIENVQTKEFNYDVSLLNRKSNFTIEDAAKIAANIYSTDQDSFLSRMSNPLKNHYLELLSDCIKGTNQDRFKLHTVELWCSSYDEFGESYSKRYDNGTYLKQTATVDCQLTVITKQEFVRWCEYEDINTGLTFEIKNFNESLEALKAENEKLKALPQPQMIRQAPPLLNNDDKTKQLNIKIEQLNKEIEQLNKELDLLKENSFPVMTSHLKAALSAQKKYWVDYDIKSLPLQKNVQQHIQEALNIKLTTDNRNSKSLSVAIQPDDITRR